MKNILVINSGSTSLKYKLFNEKGKELKSGNLTDVKSTEQAIKTVLKEIGDLHNLAAVGHRVVHGGDKFFESIVLNDEIINELERFNELAPLHNPYNLAGIKAIKDYLPDVPQVAVFDTAFYFNLPDVARIYAIPKSLAEKYKIRKYGFHGISHKYAMESTAEKLKKKIEKINLITCHLGGGWSITAIKAGKPIDTSMGWTPMEGLLMMTRPGDIDPGVVIELIRKSDSPLAEQKCEEVYNLLNRESGIKGLTGLDNFQDVLREASLGYKEARLAFDMAVYRLAKYIGSYWAVLEGKVDAIVFTGAIGAGNPMTRNAVMKKLKFLGKIPAIVIKADEELMIAGEARKLLSL